MESKYKVVISGMSGKFPDCDNVPEFADKLNNGTSFMSLKNSRWPINYNYKYTGETVPPATGKWKYLKEFDSVVFKMSRPIAECTDLNRKIFEPAFEAVMDAGLNPYELDGRNIGVYTVCAHCDTDSNSAEKLGEGRLWVLGASKTMLANRISFAFNLTGPSYTFGNDIFGSFAALNEAYRSISQGHVEAAIVGVFSAVLHPIFALHLVRMNFLSMDAITRAFDKCANGYGRSEAVVVFYLQRSEDAKRVYGTIDFSGHTYYGSNPNAFLAYGEDLLRNGLMDLYSQSNYRDIDDISFMEMSASGIKRFDRVEANAIADVLCAENNKTLMVGSIKSNVGNTEVAAPFVGLVKTILALESGSIVPNQNLHQINDEIRALKENKLQVVTKQTILTSNKVAANSVGLTGALSQVILRGNPKKHIPGGSVKDQLPRLVLICSRTEDGMDQVMRKLERMPLNTDFISLLNDVFGTDMPFHNHRGYSILSSDLNYPRKKAREIKGNKNRPVWFLFSGMGSQWNGMGKGLLEVPIFAETVKKCHDVLKTKGIDIYYILTTNDPTIFDNIVHAFVGIITVQIALVEILKALGIKPDGIIGHSVGENACAYADGCLTLEQAVLSSYARGIASIETETVKGMMAAVGKGYNQIKDSLPPNIQVACHNSSTSSTLSGPAEDVRKFVQQLQDEKVFARAVNVANIAYHSKYIAPAAPNLLARLREVIPTPIERSSKWISTSVAEKDWDTSLAKTCSAEYLTNNLLNCVMFEEGCKHIPSDALLIEVAPHGLLQAIVKRSLPETCANVSLTTKNKENNNIENLLTAIGKLYISGCDVKMNALYPPIEYPVPRTTPSLTPFATWSPEGENSRLLDVKRIGSDNGDPIIIRINDDSPYHFLKYHRIGNQIVIPTSFYLYIAWYVFSIERNIALGSSPIVFKDIKLFRNINISLHKPRSFTICIQRGSGIFEILKCSKSNSDKITQVMTGILYESDDIFNHQVEQNERLKTKHTTGEQFYNVLKDVGYQLSDTFRNVEELNYNKTDLYGKLTWNENWVSFLDSLLKFSMFANINNSNDLLYPRSIRMIEISANEISSLEKGTTLTMRKEISTNRITCNGLMISDVQYEYFRRPRKENVNLKLEGLHFVSHTNPRCQNVAEFIKLCLQIAVDNVPIMLNTYEAKLNIIENVNTTKSVKQIIKECSALKSKISFCQLEDTLTNQLSVEGNCFFIITGNVNEAQKYHFEHLFLLTFVRRNECIFDDPGESFAEITKQSFSEYTFCLHKKKPTMNAPAPRVFISDENWTDNRISNASKHLQPAPTFIIKRNTNSSDLALMLNEKKPKTNFRYVFFMDENISNDFSLRNQLSKDLPVAVKQFGEWGSYRPVDESPIPHNSIKPIEAFPTNVQLDSNLTFFSTDNHKEYSENHYSEQKLAGLPSANSFVPIREPDPELNWTVPNTWSPEDAVTVPFIYAQAYNILNIAICGQIYAESALVNVGDQSSLAEACISILLHKKHTVYVTVANDQEAAVIRCKFPTINSSRIFNQQVQNYEVELLIATKGSGVGLVINCLSHINHIESCINCLDSFGYCVQVGDIASNEVQSLGLYCFLKSISFVLVPHQMATLLNLSSIDKQRLKVLVDEGIKTGTVVPFQRMVQAPVTPQHTVNSEQSLHIKTISECSPQNETYDTTPKMQYDGHHSYIIIGGEKKNGSWFQLLEWLVSKGARKFIVAIKDFSFSPKISHQMNRLLNQKKVSIILTSSQKATTVQDAAQLIEDANRMAQLEAVFFISMDSCGNKISNVDTATRQINYNIHLVSIFSGGLKECESRRYSGFPALVIHAIKSSQNLSSVLPLIDNVLESFDNSNSPTLYRIVDSHLNDQQIERPCIRHYLPSNLRTLESIGCELSDTFEFVEVTTLSPRFDYVKDITPIFVISALGPKPLRGLFSNLTYPTFCTSATICDSSPEEVASKLYESINRIQRDGGITVIAETWRSPLAFELTNLILRDGRKYKLFILEGNPSIWQERVFMLGPVTSDEFENNLLAQIFDIDPKHQFKSIFDQSHSLLEKIGHYLSKQNHPAVNADDLAKVINVIRSDLYSVPKYNFNKDELIQHTISMVQRFSENQIMNFSVSSELFVHEENDYYKFLSSPKISQKINDEVIYNMWHTKK